MARIVFMAPFGAEFFGGQDTLEITAGNLFELVRTLDGLSPGFAESAETRLTFAIDGMVASDWSTPLSSGSEVLVVPRIGGG